MNPGPPQREVVPLLRSQSSLDRGLVGARTAAMDPDVREAVLDHLRDNVVPGPSGVVAHPLELTIVTSGPTPLSPAGR